MRKTTLGETLARIQRLVEREKGAPLSREGERLLREAVADATGEGGGAPVEFLRRDVTILLADLRGFTAVSELHPAGVVLDVLNRYLGRMTEIIVGHGGTIDKFMGDSIMAVFGVPDPDPEDARHAVECAVDMQIAMEDFNRDYRNVGMPELFMGVGINTGAVMAGTLGSRLYSEYTVIGNEVNLASRIEAISLRGQVLMGEKTFERCRDFVEAGEPIELYVKGKAKPVTLRELIGVPSLRKTVPRRELRRSPRAEVAIPFSYRIVDKSLVLPEERRGTILDLSYHGVLAEVAQPEAPHDEMKLSFNLPTGRAAENLYAKVVSARQQGDRSLCNLEFTSLSAEDSVDIRRSVHMLMMERRDLPVA